MAREERSTVEGYLTKAPEQIFKQKHINNAMSPFGVRIRESRDSEEHPNSLPIIIALDVTGSMGSVPHNLVKNGLPNIMDGIIKAGIPDPQLLFLGIGDHECDNAPLQVGQFESSDELLDKWLTTVWLEGGGGGNDGESYHLAWYFASRHTSTDSFEKRGKKGYLFTIGDEPVLDRISANQLKDIMGEGQYGSPSAKDLLEEAMKAYNVYHIHISETYSGHRQPVMDGWKQLLSDNLIIAQGSKEVAEMVKQTILEAEGREEEPEKEVEQSKPNLL